MKKYFFMSLFFQVSLSYSIFIIFMKFLMCVIKYNFYRFKTKQESLVCLVKWLLTILVDQSMGLALGN